MFANIPSIRVVGEKEMLKEDMAYCFKNLVQLCFDPQLFGSRFRINICFGGILGVCVEERLGLDIAISLTGSCTHAKDSQQ